MPTCPRCKRRQGQSKSGFTGAGSQRYQCTLCGLRYTPQPKPRGYPEAVRREAIRLYTAGVGFRQIGRLLDVDHQTVINWVKAHTLSDN